MHVCGIYVPELVLLFWKDTLSKQLLLTGLLMGYLLLNSGLNSKRYTFATGSDDNTVRLWDLRKRKAVTVIPAHNTLVSCVKYEVRDICSVFKNIKKQNGDFLISGAFDNSCKLWALRRTQWSLISHLSGHEGKVVSLDVAHGSNVLRINLLTFTF